MYLYVYIYIFQLSFHSIIHHEININIQKSHFMTKDDKYVVSLV